MGSSRSGWPGTAWPGSPARSTTQRSRARRRPTPAVTPPKQHCVVAAHRPRDPGELPLHGAAGVEPAAHRLRPGRPGDTGLGHRPVQRWNLPEGWIISARPAHPAIVSEADFISVQDLTARRGPGSLPGRCYQLAGLLRCGTCERLMESCWSNGTPAYRCRHQRAHEHRQHRPQQIRRRGLQLVGQEPGRVDTAGSGHRVISFRSTVRGCAMVRPGRAYGRQLPRPVAALAVVPWKLGVLRLVVLRV